MKNCDMEYRMICRRMLGNAPKKTLNYNLCLAVLVVLIPSAFGCVASRQERVPTASDYYLETRYNTRLAKNNFQETQEINFKMGELSDQLKASAGRAHAVWKSVK